MISTLNRFFIFKKYFTRILNFSLYIIILEKPWTLEKVITKIQRANDTITFIYHQLINYKAITKCHKHEFYACHVCVISHVQIFATSWTVALQVLQSMEFSSQYRSGFLFPPPGDYSWPGHQTQVSWISCTGRWILSLHHPGSPGTYIKLCRRYWYYLHITDEEIECKVLTLPEIHASHIKIHLLKDIWAPSSHKYAVLAQCVL